MYEPHSFESTPFTPSGSGIQQTKRSVHMSEDLTALHDIVGQLIEYRSKRLSLISSENATSQLMRATYGLGLSDQYCSRLPSAASVVGNLTFSNIGPLDEINRRTRELALQLFGAAECDVRLLSGLSGLTVLLFSLLRERGVLFKVADQHGGHLSTRPIAARLGLEIRDMCLSDEYRLDIDQFRRLNQARKPDLVFLDSSYVLFPYPVAEIREIVGPNVPIVYDASHVLALVATDLFQQPFKEGADIVHSTTHKTLWGPQKSMILFRDAGGLVKAVQETVQDLVSNTHLHHIFALYVALLEFQHFGREYALQLKKNAKAFAEAAARRGLSVVAARQGFTESNQVWIDLGSKEEATAHFRTIDKSNISLNIIFLPQGRWGWRIGLNELTRLGATVDHVETVAALLSDLVQGRKSVEQVNIECHHVRKDLGSPKYCFDAMQEARQIVEQIQAQGKGKEFSHERAAQRI